MEFVQRGITDSNGLNHESSKRESNQYMHNIWKIKEAFSVNYKTAINLEHEFAGLKLWIHVCGLHVSCSEAVCHSQMEPNWILTNLIAIHLGIPWR